MLRRSPIAAAFALATVTSSAIAGNAETVAVHHRTVVHHVYTYEPAPSPDYGPHYGPAYAPAFGPVASPLSLGLRFVSPSRCSGRADRPSVSRFAKEPRPVRGISAYIAVWGR
jgi:hypothetical protein